MRPLLPAPAHLVFVFQLLASGARADCAFTNRGYKAPGSNTCGLTGYCNSGCPNTFVSYCATFGAWAVDFSTSSFGDTCPILPCGFGCMMQCSLGDGCYAPATSAVGTFSKCPAGTQCTKSSCIALADCGSCAAGNYATLGSGCISCPAGRYGATSGLTASTCSGLCVCGRYGSATGLTSSSCTGACAAGRYGLASSARTTSTCSGLCSPGYYCPSGSCSATQNACPVGTFGSSSGLSVATCSGLCLAGYFGGTAAQTANTCTGLCDCGTFGSATGLSVSTCSGLCDAGSFGLPSTVRTTSSCDGQCSMGFYCPAGSCSATQYACPAGTFGATLGLSTSSCSGQCALGYWGSDAQTDAKCSGPCACGRYGSAPGQAANTCSGLCDAGSFGLPSTVRTTAACDGLCSPGYYCPAGSCSATQNACPAGTYSGAAGASSAATCLPCGVAGSYSVAGSTSCAYTASTCPIGTYAMPPAACASCDPVTACTVPGLTAQPPCYWNVSTLAGNGALASSDNVGTSASFSSPEGMLFLPSGTLLVGDSTGNVIRAVDPVTRLVATLPLALSIPYAQGLVSMGDSVFTTSGTGSSMFQITGGVASVLESGQPAASCGLATDDVFLYASAPGSHSVYRVSLDGAGAVFAGSGSAGFANGGGVAAQFNYPTGLAFYGGSVFVSDTWNSRIRVVSTSTAVVSSFAGSGVLGSLDGLGTAAQLSTPWGLAIDGNSGTLYFTEVHLIGMGCATDGSVASRVRSVSPAGLVRTLAGAGYGFVDAFGLSAQFACPVGIAIGAGGRPFIADTLNNRIRQLVCIPCPAAFYCASGGPVLCPAGAYCPFSSLNPTLCPAGTFSAALGASSIATCAPCGCALDCQPGSAVDHSCTPSATASRSSTASQSHTAVATATGTPTASRSSSPTATGSHTSISSLSASACATARGTATAPATFSPTTSTTGKSTLSGAPTGTGTPTGSGTGAASASALATASASATASSCSALPGYFCVGGGAAAPCPIGAYCVGGLGVSSTACYPATACPVPGLSAQPPCYWAVDTLAGSGTAAFSDGLGSAANFFNPIGVATDINGNVLVGDRLNNRVRKVTPVGVVSTLAGSGAAAFSDGTGTGASFNEPGGLAVRSNGNLVVADSAAALHWRLNSWRSYRKHSHAPARHCCGTAPPFSVPFRCTDLRARCPRPYLHGRFPFRGAVGRVPSVGNRGAGPHPLQAAGESGDARGAVGRGACRKTTRWGGRGGAATRLHFLPVSNARCAHGLEQWGQWQRRWS